MTKLLRYAAIGIAAVGFSAGVAGASSGSIGTTGPGSVNWSQFNNNLNYSHQNHNSAHVANINNQWTATGSANVSGNTNGGSATTGNASTSNNTSTTLNVSNSGSGAGAWVMAPVSDNASIGTTGPNSNNWVQFNNNANVNTVNNNCVAVTNNNNQASSTGSANVSGNTNGGSATTGSASASNSTSTSINITN